jgi:predicted nucleotidyltransferase
MAVQTLTHVLELVREQQDQIKAFGVKRLGLFGSFVREEQDDESDIDHDIVWDAVATEIPALQEQIRRIVRMETIK